METRIGRVCLFSKLMLMCKPVSVENYVSCRRILFWGPTLSVALGRSGIMTEHVQFLRILVDVFLNR